jgi:hypothetical protein
MSHACCPLWQFRFRRDGALFLRAAASGRRQRARCFMRGDTQSLAPRRVNGPAAPQHCLHPPGGIGITRASNRRRAALRSLFGSGPHGHALPPQHLSKDRKCPS